MRFTAGGKMYRMRNIPGIRIYNQQRRQEQEKVVVPAEEGQKCITFRQSLRVWIKVAIYSFGGPAGQIAVMHKLLVEEKRWISESRFLHALNYCMLLPGPEAQQLAIYIGWLLHRSAERRGGTECVSTCRSRLLPYR